MLELGLKILLSYLLGSLNGSLLLGKILGGPDVRSVGSGNAGGTNALRVRGKSFAMAVMVIDVGKGFLAVTYLAGLALPLAAGEPEVSATALAVACAAAAIIGHCYPVWFGFMGGKGAATSVGAILALSPWLLIPALVTWLLVVATTGFVGLATIAAAVFLPVYAMVTGFPGGMELFAFLLLLAFFVFYTHRSNILRMMRNQENRMTGLMILRRRV